MAHRIFLLQNALLVPRTTCKVSCFSEPAKPSSSISTSFRTVDGSGASASAHSRVCESLARNTHIVDCAATSSIQHVSSGNGALPVGNQETPSTKMQKQDLFRTEDPKYSLLSDVRSLADALRVGGLDASLLSYRENFVIRCYEVGMNRTASIETIANLLQEVACDHALSVGFSTDGFATTPSMRKRRLIWVTTRMHIEVDDYPVWGDVVQLETWCQTEGKVGTRRDWLMTNVATGKLISRATSTWVMMNEDTRRLSRITDDVRDEYMPYFPTIPRYAFPEDNSSCLKKIPKLDEPAEYMRSGLTPRRGDLDMNQHVNNVAYIGWTLESVPQHVLDTHQLHRITLDYRRECKYGDVVEALGSLECCPYTADSTGHMQPCPSATSNGTAINGSVSAPSNGDGIEFLHFLRLAGTVVEINRGRSVWKRKSDKVVEGKVQTHAC